MRRFYSFLMYALTPYLLLRLWLKGRQIPAYRKGLLERFALSTKKTEHVDVWIHAVSLGEAIAISPFIEYFLNKKNKLLVTTMTPTGLSFVQQRFGDKLRSQYLPYDLPFAVKRFYKQNKVGVAVFVETELWPNLAYYAKCNQISLFIVNARLSERSFRSYQKARWFFKPVLECFEQVFAQTDEDAKRYMALGMTKVSVLGNMKFDLQTQRIPENQFIDIKERWGNQRVVFIAASTHEQEEALILSRIPTLKAAIPNLIVLVAPRHPERFNKVFELSLQMGFDTGRRSDIETLTTKNDVVILDSLGELLGFYQLSDYAFVGGSLVPIGGHNVLEPIAMKVAVFTGPYVQNFKAICRDLVDAEAIKMVGNVDALIQEITTLHQDKCQREALIQRATDVLHANKGTVLKYTDKIESALRRASPRLLI